MSGKYIDSTGVTYLWGKVKERVQANPTGTGTADLTKLKVGETVYNIPSGSSSDVSVFDLTPYFGGGESIGTEGFNALKDYITNNKCPIVRLDLDGQMYVFNVAMYGESAFICSNVTEDSGDIIALRLHIDNSGKVTVTSAQIDPVEGVGDQGTYNLVRLNIGGVFYYIPKLETYNLAINNNTGKPLPLKILTCETTTDGKNLLKVYNSNFGIGHNEASLVVGIVYKQVPSNHSGFIDLFTTKEGTFAILTANAEYSVSSSGGDVSVIDIDTELSETSENPVQNKAVTTAITSLRERKYDQNNFQLRDGDYTSYQKDLSRVYRTEFNENGEKTNVSYRIPVIKAGGSMGAGWKPFEGINLDGQDYVFWLNNYKFGTNEEYKHTSSNFDYAEIQDLMYNGFRYRTQTIIDLDKLGFSSGRETLTDEIITMIKNGSNIVIIHGGVTYRDYTEDTDYYNFTAIDCENHPNDYWVRLTLRIGKNDNSLLLFNGNRHYFVDANSTTVAYNYLTRLKVGNTNYIVSYVKANPSETGTENLTKLKVGSTVYNIPSGGGVNILELNDTDATAVGNAIENVYSSDNDTTEISLTTPVDFSKTYQFISYLDGTPRVTQAIRKSASMDNVKLYWILDRVNYFDNPANDNRMWGLTLVVTEENGVSSGRITVGRQCIM